MCIYQLLQIVKMSLCFNGLELRKPLWRDMQSIDVTSRWREDWQSAMVVNSTLMVDPTIRLPGFDLHRRQWSLLNRFRTDQGHCNACHKKWGFTDNELCDCGEIQTMSHIVKFDGGLLCLQHMGDNIWLLAHDNNSGRVVTELVFRSTGHGFEYRPLSCQWAVMLGSWGGNCWLAESNGSLPPGLWLQSPAG